MKHQRLDYMRIQEPANLLNIIRRLKDGHDWMPEDADLEKEVNETLEFYDSLPQPENPIGEDEPVFLIRAKDRFAPQMVQAYANCCSEMELPFAHEIYKMADTFRKWQLENGCKVPDQMDLFT